MLNLHKLIRWNILPSSWPFQMSPANIAKRISEKEIELTHNKISNLSTQMELLKNEVLLKYPDVFKNELGPEDRIRCDPVRLTFNDKKIKSYNAMTAIEIPLHSQKAADNQLAKMLSVEVLEQQTKVTVWTARVFFLPKPGRPEEARW